MFFIFLYNTKKVPQFEDIHLNRKYNPEIKIRTRIGQLNLSFIYKLGQRESNIFLESINDQKLNDYSLTLLNYEENRKRRLERSFNSIKTPQKEYEKSIISYFKKINILLVENYKTFNYYQLDTKDFNILLIGFLKYVDLYKYQFLNSVDFYENIMRKYNLLFTNYLSFVNHPDPSFLKYQIHSLYVQQNGYPCDQAHQIVNDLHNINTYTIGVKYAGSDWFEKMIAETAHYYFRKCSEVKSTRLSKYENFYKYDKKNIIYLAYFYRHKLNFPNDIVKDYYLELKKLGHLSHSEDILSELLSLKISQQSVFSFDYLLLLYGKVKTTNYLYYLFSLSFFFLIHGATLKDKKYFFSRKKMNSNLKKIFKLIILHIKGKETNVYIVTGIFIFILSTTLLIEGLNSNLKELLL